jgi:predicted P-loop ATPase
MKRDTPGSDRNFTKYVTWNQHLIKQIKYVAISEDIITLIKIIENENIKKKMIKLSL